MSNDIVKSDKVENSNRALVRTNPRSDDKLVSTPAQLSEQLRPTEAARLELSRALASPDCSLAQAFQHACEISARTLGIERVGVWFFVQNRAAIRCANLFERSKDEHSEGAILHVADYPKYFAALDLHKAIPAEFADTDPRTAELADAYFRPLGITSILNSAILRDGGIVGVLCHEHVGSPCEWTTEARDFVGSVADALTLKMKSAQLHEVKAAFRTQEDRIFALEKETALAQMAAGIAHDFNNLLAIVASQAELLAGRTDIPVNALGQIGEMAEAAVRGTALVRGLMEFARPDRRAPTSMNLADVTASFLPVLRTAIGSGCDLQFERPATLGQVLIDKTEFTRVLLNLGINARDSMPNGGPIRIRIAPVKTSETVGPSSNFILLEVVDCGIGMDEATRLRIFEPFFTTKTKGTGLGMPIVRRVVDRAGGFLRIESTVGAGTSVQAFFPRVGGSSGRTTEFALPPEVLGQKGAS